MYADSPTDKEMESNGLTDYDIFNINLTKSYPDIMLKSEFLATLTGFSDIEDGLGYNGRALANHFFTGHGQDFIFSAESNPSREVRGSSRFNSRV